MKKRTKITLIVLGALLVVGGVAAWQWSPILRAYYAHCVRGSTIGLPRCDRVEVCYLDGETGADASTGFPVRPYDAFSRILDRKTLTGPDAEALAGLWRSQTFGFDYQAMCHGPAYGFRFYRGSSLKFETSVCFHCSNFYVTVLGESDWWGFDTGVQSATNFLTRLQEIFPASVPKPKSKAPNKKGAAAKRSITPPLAWKRTVGHLCGLSDLYARKKERAEAQRRRERRGPAVGIESAMDGESAPTTHAPNKAAPVNAPVAFWFHAGRAWRRVTEQQR